MDSNRGVREMLSEELRGVEIEKGTKIVCPLCKKEVGYFKRTLKVGEIISVKHIHIYNVKLKEGEELLCPYCGFPLTIEVSFAQYLETRKGYKYLVYHGLLIHTNRGWMPFEIIDKKPLTRLVEWLKRAGRWRKEWGKYLSTVC